eukprot:Skav224006  [mRNA]  locus=scaffold2932:36153:38416:+ [translate_table: standard]
MWWCQQCQHSNTADSECCALCHRHWQYVWAPKRRSRSHKDKRKKEDSSKDSKDKAPKAPVNNEEMKPRDVIPERVPWMTTTPNAHLQNREVSLKAASSNSNIPPDPVLPPPPVAMPEVHTEPAGLSEEETKVLSHLKGLVDMGVDLPEPMASQLQTLQNKAKPLQEAKTLNHGHLHRFNRLRGQVQSAAQKIVSLDQEWASFLKTVTSQVQKHMEMYQACRLERVETYQKRVAELAQARQEVTAASQLLLDKIPEPETAPIAPDPETTLGQLNEVMAKASAVDPVDLTSEGMEAEEAMDSQEEMIEPSKHSTYRRPITVAPFGKATSPHKVSNAHLKKDPRKTQLVASAVCSLDQIFHRNWTWIDEALTEQDRPSPVRRVRFGEEVSVHVYRDDGYEGKFLAPLQCTQTLFRGLWHLDGQCCSSSRFCEIFQCWRVLQMHPPQRTQGLDSITTWGLPCCSLRWDKFASDRVASLRNVHFHEIHFLPHLIAQIEKGPSTRQHHFIEVWYLHSRLHHVCLRARRLRFDPSWSVQELQMHMAELWLDFVDVHLDIAFQLVIPEPTTLRATIAHVILLQAHDVEIGSALMHFCGPLSLSTHRAILGYPQDRVWQVFQRAQYFDACESEARICAIELPDETTFLAAQALPLFQGTLLHARFVHMAESDDLSLSARSTSLPETTDEDLDVPVSEDEVDSISLMNAGQPVFLHEDDATVIHGLTEDRLT